ncbi:MAG: hypothetical protein GX442_07215 [Candidatus Riflebacteria bacterium]|nr:hypothetical protein [Candidatus Riflebacteria bacterium]
MSPRHPLSSDPRDRGLPFWGGLLVLAILVVTIRWTRGPAPADLTSGSTPLPPGPAAPAGFPTPGVPLVQAPVPVPAAPLSAGPAPVAQPLPAVSPALPAVGPAPGAAPTFIPQVGPGQQTVAMSGLPVVAPAPAPGAAPIPQVGAPAAPGLTILPTGKPPVVTPAQLVGLATVPRVIPAYWVLTVQMPPVNAILPAPDGRVWAATDRGLAELRTDQITFLSREAGTFPAANATALAHDGRALWIGTFEGLLRTEDGRTFQRFGRPDGLAHDMVWSLEWDGMVLWAGTQNGFSFLAPNGRFESVDKTVSNGGLADLWVGALRKMGRWVLCGNDDGLSIWDTSSFAANPAAWTTLDMFATNLAHNWILALTVWQDRVYAGTPLGLCRLDTPLDRLFAGERPAWDVWNRSRGLPGDRVNALAPLGDTLWVGTNEGLARLRGAGARAIGPGEGLLASEVRALAAAGETVWVGTSAGLQALNPALLDR